jgi:CPA2 family monovalent cation:H+ antiporter-2
MHLPPLIQDLAIILIVAGIMTLIFRAIRQPVVLGYIVAGFLVGPHFKWVPSVVDTESVKVWAEIGVIFLLFALGLEFSFKKLAKVGHSASITAIAEVAGMTAIGYLTGKIFGWNTMDSLFLGGMLAISSTTIIIRAFDELNMKARSFVGLVFGVLIVEDLVAILLMAGLSTIAVSQTVSGLALGLAGLKLVFFLIIWFLLGIFLIPSFLNRIRPFSNNESLLVVALGLCFLMVVLATKAGFSPALGAFIMGSLLAETVDGGKIEQIIHPVKNLFGAIFFVSVGMLIDPQILIQYWIPILVITLITTCGKFLTTLFGALLSRQSLRHSVQAGMSLAQIGEFSFIIAGLGLSLSVTSDFLYPIAISVSAITTFTTPYLIRSSDTMVHVLETRLPQKWLARLTQLQAASTTPSPTEEWKTTAKSTGLKVILNAVSTSSIFLTISEFLMPQLMEEGVATPWVEIGSLMVALTLASPFLWAIMNVKHPGKTEKIMRWVVGTALFLTLATEMVNLSTACVMGAIGFGVMRLLSHHLEAIYRWLRKRFEKNLKQI